MADLHDPVSNASNGAVEADNPVAKDDELDANPGALWAQLSSFERQMARTRKDILNSTTSVTSADLRECIHNARADWPAAMEPFKDVNDALERLLPYHACYEQDSAEDSTVQLDKVLATVQSRVSGVRNETKLCREATARDTAKRKLNVVKSIEFEELSHKSGRLRQESRIEAVQSIISGSRWLFASSAIMAGVETLLVHSVDRIEREIQLQRAAAKLQAAKAQEEAAAAAAQAATTSEEKVKTEDNEGTESSPGKIRLFS